MTDIVERLQRLFSRTTAEIERLRAELAAQTKAHEKMHALMCKRTDELVVAQAELAAIKGQIADPSWVCLEGMSASEFAAFDYGSKCCMDALRRILDGEDKGVGTCNEPWESLRRRVLALVAQVADEDVERKVVDCWCETCDVAKNLWRTRMSICPDCGSKRCPKAAHHDNACNGMAKGE